MTKYLTFRLDYIMSGRRDPQNSPKVDFARVHFYGVVEGLCFAKLITYEQKSKLANLGERAAAIFHEPLDLDLIHEKELTEMVNAILTPEPSTLNQGETSCR